MCTHGLCPSRRRTSSIAETIERLTTVILDHDRTMRAVHEEEIRELVQEMVKQGKAAS